MAEAEDRRKFLADEARQFRANELNRQLATARAKLFASHETVRREESYARIILKAINRIKREACEEGIELK